MKKTGSLDVFGSPWRLWIGMNSSKYLFACWTLRLYQDVRAPFTVCNMQPSLFCDVFSWQVSTVYAHLISIKKKKQKKLHIVTLGGFGLFIQGTGLAPEAFSCAIDPDVGDHACVPLRQTHVLLAHGLVELGAEWNRCHVHLEEDRSRTAHSFAAFSSLVISQPT